MSKVEFKEATFSPSLSTSRSKARIPFIVRPFYKADLIKTEEQAILISLIICVVLAVIGSSIFFFTLRGKQTECDLENITKVHTYSPSCKNYYNFVKGA